MFTVHKTLWQDHPPCSSDQYYVGVSDKPASATLAILFLIYIYIYIYCIHTHVNVN